MPAVLTSLSRLGPALRHGGRFHGVWPRRITAVLLVMFAIAVDLVVWGGVHMTRWRTEFPLWLIPSTTALVYATILMPRRYLGQVFALQLVYGLGGALVPGYQPFAGLLVALHLVARSARPRRAWTALALCAAPFSVDSLDSALATRNPVLTFAVTALLWSALSGTVWGLGRSAYNSARRAESARAREAEDAVRGERLRLARELHDIVAHAVSLMVLQAAGARTLLPPAETETSRALAAIEDAGIRAMDELHRLLSILREAGAVENQDQPTGIPTVERLDDLVAAVRPPGLDVETLVRGAPTPLDGSVSLACFRTIQECMTNTLKHAGAGSIVRVRATWEPEQLELLVTDRAGSHPTPAPTALSSGHGLAGLRERVTLLGGSCEYGPIAGGWRVMVAFPLSTKILASYPVRPARAEAET